MKANVPKCMSLAIRASSGKPYDPKLMLNKEAVPYIGDSTFHFLGAPISLHNTSMQARESLLEKLRAVLQKVDATLVTRQQKLKLYKVGICPRLAWDLSVSDFPTTWLQTKLQPLATSFLKKWSGLAKSVDSSRLFLPKANGGLDLPELTTLYKKLHAANAVSYMYSRDPVVRFIATQETLKEAKLKRPAFRPFQEVVEVMKDDPGATRKRITTQVKAKVQAADNEARLAHSAGLSVQGQTCTGLPWQSCRPVVHHSVVPPRVHVQVCPQCTDRHTAPQLQPPLVEEASISFMQPVWSAAKPAACVECLPLCSGEKEVQRPT